MMKQLILFPLLFIFIISIVYSAGGWDEGNWDDGVWDFGTPELVESSLSTGGGGDSGGGGGGRLIDGINEPKFESGSKTLDLKYADVFRFYIKKQSHLAIILNVNQKDNTIKIRLTSTPMDLIFKVKETKVIDLDDDKINDISVKLNNINKYGGSFTFTILEKPIAPISTIPEPIDTSIGGLDIAEEPQVIDVEEPSLENDEPIKEQPKSIAIWVIAISVIIFGILLIVAYQINKNKKSNKDNRKI